MIQGIWAFEGRSSLKAWIFRILINRPKTRAAREGRIEAAEAVIAPDHFQPVDHPTEPGRWTHPPPDLGASPERWLLAQEAHQHLQSAIAALPEHQRLVLILRDVEGCSPEEDELLLVRAAPTDVANAEECFRQALEWGRRQDALSWELRSATSLAPLYHRQGRPPRRARCWPPSTGASQKGSRPPIC